MSDVDDTVIAPPRSPGSPRAPQRVPGDATMAEQAALDGDTVVRDRVVRDREPFALVEPQRPGAAPSPGTAQPPATEHPATRFHSIRIGEHEPIPLDVPAYIGRRPSRPRIASGTQPRLVRVPSPRKEVSSTHVEIRQEGSAVVVTDLGSTNGTSVEMPGAATLTLRRSESVVVIVGTVVDIGDGIHVHILPARELTAREVTA